jgi:hypothetical protein
VANELVHDVQMRDQVVALEESMRAMPEHQIHIEPRHYFAHGLYAREITIPKGTVLTGKIHLFEHINIISAGDISVMTEHGIRRIKAPATIVSKPGMKRVGWAHEDTMWTTIHACDVQDGDEAERLLVVDTFEEFEKLVGGTPCPLLP